MNARRFEELLVAWEDNSLAPEELVEFKRLLISEPQARRRLVEAGVLRVVAESESTAAPQPAAEGHREASVVVSPFLAWRQWRPLAAAVVAGIVFGMICTSVVWAYAGSWRQAVALVRESFETGAMQLDAGFPKTAGVWSGDAARVVTAVQGITPKEGTRMLRLEPVKDLWNAQSFIMDLRQLAPAPAGAARVVRLAASFRADPSEIRDRYMARVAAFVEAPGEMDPRWMSDLWGSEENHAVAQAARATTFSPYTPGWQTLQLTMDLPPGSRFLVISLRAATMHGKPEMRAAHYLDDVRVTLETLQTREARP